LDYEEAIKVSKRFWRGDLGIWFQLELGLQRRQFGEEIRKTGVTLGHTVVNKRRK
jgi:hypothetical protein